MYLTAMAKKTDELYGKRKRRFLAEISESGELKRKNAWVSIHTSSKELLGTFESEGLVVSINGGGESMTMEHPHAQDAIKLAEYVVAQGGIVVNGGRPKGIMEASSIGGGTSVLGVLFPEIDPKTKRLDHPYVMVNAPTPRIEILGTCPPVIVIFQGGLGTLQQVVRSIVHINNRKYHPDQMVQLVFISNYWMPLLQTLVNMHALPAEFLQSIAFFSNSDEIISALPKA